MYVLGYIEVKAWVIHKNDHVRLPLCDVLLAHLHVLENGGQMHQDGNDAHVGQFLVVFDTCSSYSSHHVAPKEAELRFRVFAFQ